MSATTKKRSIDSPPVTTTDNLQKEITRLKRLIALTPSVTYITDIRNDNTCIFVSDNIREIMGHKPEEMTGNATFWYENVHPEDRDETVRQCEILVQRGGGIVEYRFCTDEDKYNWIEDRFRVIYDTQGVAEQIFGTWTDITERRNTEITLRSTNQMLELRQNEIEVLGKLNDHLYVCNSVEDTKKVIEHYLTQLFPDSSGSVYMFNQSRSMLEAIASWGQLQTSEELFVQEDCWALRQGKMHLVNNNITDLTCPHVKNGNEQFSYICLPLIAQSDVLGLVHLATVSNPEDLNLPQGSSNNTPEELATNVSKQLSLSLMNLRLRESLKTQATRDPLTQLFNRRFMLEFLDKELIRTERNKSNLGFMMLDVDHFKQFNDVYGHDAGDAVLREVATVLRANVRGSDIACRYGGEEFALVFPDMPLQQLMDRGEAVRTAIKQLRVSHNSTAVGTISISIGISMFPQNGNEATGLITKADKALYQAKANGRDCIVMSTTDDK